MAQAAATLTTEQKAKIAAFAEKWWKARPPTKFDDWNPDEKKALVDEAKAFGAIPEGAMAEVVQILWKPSQKLGPKPLPGSKGAIKTPYGEATFLSKGVGGKQKGLVIGLHGGGEGAGSAGEAAGSWSAANSIGVYPQGIRLVHDTWNTVHGERFILTLIEIAKCAWQIDPDRVYSMGFSMGGTGSWFMAGRHPDLLAGSSPCAGVLMASPKSQLPKKEDVDAVEHGLVPNVRNLAMWYYIGLADKNCMPGTYLFVEDMLAELKKDDPTGYTNVHFKTIPGLAHAFPPGEPATGIKFLEKQKRDTFPKKIVWEYAAAPQPLPGPDDKSTRLDKNFFYWIRCKNLVDRQLITAEIDGNTIRIIPTGTGKTGLTIYLNAKMIDPKKDVVVYVDKDEVYRKKPEPDFFTVFETLDERVDTSMVFDRRIDL